jgi:hypothetical protein
MKRRTSKQRDLVITAVAHKIFGEMRQCACTCTAPEDWVMDPCPGCRRWQQLHQHLWRELHFRLWEWPCVYRFGSPDLEQALAEAAVQRLA